MITLTPRLEAVAKFVLPGQVVADIGTDHAYIPIYLVQSGNSQKAIATDIHDGPYRIARDRVNVCGLQDKIDVRKGDGFRPVKAGEAQVAVLAGMGGITIRDILCQSPQVVNSLKQLVLQPMTAPEEVRRWLAENGWKLDNECIIKEDENYYQIISAVKGTQIWPEKKSSLLWHLGSAVVARGDFVILEYIEKLITVNRKLLAELGQLDTPKGKARIKELEQQIDEMEELREICRLNANS
jgi:tRNA (adenine22-N1)-methyltransferase